MYEDIREWSKVRTKINTKSHLKDSIVASTQKHYKKKSAESARNMLGKGKEGFKAINSMR